MPSRAFEIEISNLELIAACWGPDVAEHVARRIASRLKEAGLQIEQDATCRRFRILCDAGSARPVGWDRLADLSYRLTAEPICIEAITGEAGAGVHAVMTWQNDEPPRYRGPRDVRRDHGDGWFALYKNDMQAVAQAFHCAGEGRMAAHWQPVRHYADSSRILYHEGLARFDDPGAMLSPATIFPALERTGTAATFDWVMVRHVLDELRAHPQAVLAVNISANSAHLNGWWRGVLDTLTAQPDLAARLVVEITETEAIAHIHDAVAFAQALRATGATLALDDFGAGFTSIRQLMDLVPALVKIDGLFLQRATRDRDPCHGLPHLIGLIRELGGTVIVEGVETQAMADLAYVSGAVWQQGYHHGRPSAARLGAERTEPLARIVVGKG
ncbi:EAL domain-containing protein [Sphingomonas sanguinis]|uniref:EAL domain-containing protein n=1 Tax=Sphingomonas sanguinis TaxID=33051 RepID=A0ABU5LTS5_9SPHN|nr:EAL domain-containing protein [Sphingomonas sanguinis]MDZ7283317.1 EAL domain-containing protein [Sphingomonas sanguinis]QXT36893.1 EAL domain-containing protein [Sphingomonas sanguinis]